MAKKTATKTAPKAAAKKAAPAVKPEANGNGKPAAPAAAKPEATKPAATKTATKAKRAPRAKVDPQVVADLVALLKRKNGTTYAEAAKALKITSKGDKPHQTPAAQVRAMVRDRVRINHEITDGDFDSERGGQIYLIK